MFNQDREYLDQPGRIILGMVLNILFELDKPDPFVILNFARVRLDGPVVTTEIDVIEFPLGQAFTEGQSVPYGPYFSQRGAKAEFFLKPPPGAAEERHPRLRVTAAAVRPQARTVVLAGRSALEQDAPPTIEDKDRKCPV
jgi:hypothetical protein